MNEIVKYPSIEPRGLIKVELFDEKSGKKIDERKTHNFISQFVLNILFKAKMKDVFTQNRNAGGYSVSNIFTDPFQQISLTNASHPEEPLSEVLRKGDLIGYAYSDGTYSGSDVKRGTYNNSESFTNENQVHMVFDFPTHAANGTFQSIYFHNSSYSVSSNSNSISKLPFSIAVKRYNNYYYCLIDTRVLKKYDLDGNLVNEFSLNKNVYDFDIVGDEIYYALKYDGKILKAPISNPSNMLDALTIYLCNALTYDYDNHRFMLIGERNSNDNEALIIYNDDFSELISVVNLPSNFNDLYTIWYYDGSIYNSNNVFPLPLSNDSNYTILDPSFYRIRGVDGKFMYSLRTSSANLNKLPNVFIGSRALLDSPVTKNSMNTMKITYDFMLE